MQASEVPRSFRSVIEPGARHPPPDDPENSQKHLAQRLKEFLAAAWAHRWFALGVLLFAGLGLWQIALFVVGPAVTVDMVQRGDLVQSVVASGHVETPYRVNIGSQITGMVADVLVEEGQHVSQGQPLIAIERTELEAVLVHAQGAVAQAEARLRQMTELTLPVAKDNLTQAKAALEDAQFTYDRTAELASHDNASRATLYDAKKGLAQARAQVEAAQFGVFTASPGGSDAVMAQTQLDQAKANLDAARSRLNYATITAPRDGVLIARHVERGMIVQPGTALLALAPTGNVELFVDVDERNLGSLSLGQSALASADAYPKQRFAATVTYINPGIDITRATVLVKLTATDPPPYIRQDMTVSVDIEVAHRDATLVLPQRSVRDLLSENPWVMGVRDGRAYRIPVRLGLRGSSKVEILGGLQQGDIAIPESAGIAPGQHVRPVMS